MKISKGPKAAEPDKGREAAHEVASHPDQGGPSRRAVGASQLERAIERALELDRGTRGCRLLPGVYRFRSFEEAEAFNQEFERRMAAIKENEASPLTP